MCNRGAERTDAFQRQELGLQRHQHGVDRDQRVQRHQAERGRAIDQDGRPAGARIAGGQRFDQAVLAALHVDQFDLGAGQRGRGGDHGEIGNLRGADAVVERRQAEQEFIGTG